MMQHLVYDVRDAMEAELWYAGLALALSLPDAAAKCEDPSRAKNRAKYVAWAARWIRPTGMLQFGSYFDAEELYKLRCAVLHQGMDYDDEQAVVKTWKLRAPGGQGLVWGNWTGTTNADGSGSLRKDMYVTDLTEIICAGVERWLRTITGTPLARAGNTIRIEPVIGDVMI